MNVTAKPLRQSMAALAAIPAFCAAQAIAEPVAVDVPLAPVGKSSTAILVATPPKIDVKGNAAFTIDISQMGIFRKMSMAGARYTALIFNGSASNRDRLCPFFNLESRPYTIREIRPDVFQVNTAVTREETETVMKSGCAITTAPDRRKIEYLKP